MSQEARHSKEVGFIAAGGGERKAGEERKVPGVEFLPGNVRWSGNCLSGEVFRVMERDGDGGVEWQGVEKGLYFSFFFFPPCMNSLCCYCRHFSAEDVMYIHAGKIDMEMGYYTADDMDLLCIFWAQCNRPQRREGGGASPFVYQLFFYNFNVASLWPVCV